MKNKFNWSRFYDELEEGDPAKFPFWMFLFFSLSDMVVGIFQGVVLGFALVVLMVSSAALIFDYSESHPDFVVKNFCSTYMLKNSINK